MDPQTRSPLMPRRRPELLAPGRTLGDVVAALAAEGRTGAVQSTTGVVHLVEGAVLQVESAWALDLPTLLVRSGRIPAQDLLELSRNCEQPLPEALLGSGWVGRGVLELCHLTALSDAAFLALPQDSGPFRFQPDVRPRTGAIRSVEVRTLRAAVARRRALLDRVWPCPRLDGSPLRLSAGAADPAPVRWSRAQRAIVQAADGRRTPLEIARLLGRPAFATLLDVRRLAAAGLVQSPSDPDDLGRPGAQPRASAAAVPVVRPTALPAGPVRLDGGSANPELALLIRLRAALEARL
ncbi:transcriptional regulator [Kitasatospora sp. HPMI-4]|uniref:transcriptional regulator n=1 Tax=Kitasatospora sp. HPMI-4 TaxID=3448443 RepID=UPI003F1E120A